MIIRSESQWLDLFKKHELSELSAAQFCRDNKLCTRYFSKRKQQLGWNSKDQVKAIKSKKSPNDFIKVSVSKPSHSFSLEYGDIKLNWEHLPPTEWLCELVKSIK